MAHLSHDSSLTEREIIFQGQSVVFLEKLFNALNIDSLSSVESVLSRTPTPLQPVIIEDYHDIGLEQRQRLRDAYYSEAGVAYYVALNSSTPPQANHPLLDIANQLADELHLYFPLTHPLESHPEVISRFGQSDGTVKIYNLVKAGDAAGYREQGETAEMFSLHNDGLGSGGTVETTALYMDSPPLCGGYTFFQNILRLVLDLAKNDLEAFKALFLPDALTQIRPRGKGAIIVKSPVLFLNENGDPQCFFRTSSGEYKVEYRKNSPDLERAIAYLNHYSQPFSYGSYFVHFTARGHGCFIRNQVVAHGRTSFVDKPSPEQGRLLSRKWFMISERDTTYKHIPGMFLLKEYAELFPELFSPDLLEGEWLYDPGSDRNIRVK